jgi:hypothetical protein
MSERLDRAAVETLTIGLLIPIRGHYLRDEGHRRSKVHEVLNALAAVTALVVSGADGAGGEAEQFFQTALRQQLAADRDE